MNDKDNLENIALALHYILEYLNHPKKEDWRLQKANLFIQKVLTDEEIKNGTERDSRNDE